MTTKEYLDRARRIDIRLSAKLEQIEKLNDLATRITPVYSDMPKAHNPSSNRTEDVILNILDLKNEIQTDIDRLIKLKHEIREVILAVEDPDIQTVLEKRYLCYDKFEDIALSMNFGLDNVFRLHRIGLKKIVIPETIQ